eukprot:GHVU01037484.1.p2 GENE.GHVU01037484.1~~GHVU01037484.1.p2  ORF type:complete len:137 (-),score=0.77 GHVU01037484.1:70-480(-)
MRGKVAVAGGGSRKVRGTIRDFSCSSKALGAVPWINWRSSAVFFFPQRFRGSAVNVCGSLEGLGNSVTTRIFPDPQGSSRQLMSLIMSELTASVSEVGEWASRSPVSFTVEPPLLLTGVDLTGSCGCRFCCLLLLL